MEKKMSVCRSYARFFSLIFLLLLICCTARAGNIALLVGVADYKTSPLRTPIKDAEAIAQELQSIGWNVRVLKNPSKHEATKALKDFRHLAANLSQDEIALVYFSGHGFQLGSRNYLMLRGDHRSIEAAMENSVTSDEITRVMSSSSAARVILIDACRTSPLSPEDSLLVSRGLLQISAPVNTVFGFATAPNTTALDGASNLSPYAEGIVFGLRTSESLDDLFRAARRSTIYATGGEQVPWETSSLVSNYQLSVPSDGSIAEPIQANIVSELTVVTQRREEVSRLQGLPVKEQQQKLVDYILDYIRTAPLEDIYIWEEREVTEQDRQDFLETIEWERRNQEAFQFWGNLGEALVSGVIYPSCRDLSGLDHQCMDFDRSIYLPMNAAIAYQMNKLAYDLGGRTDGLARMYEEGIYVKKDYLKAYDTYLEAADRSAVEGSWSDYAWTNVNELAQRLLIALGADLAVDGDFGSSSCGELRERIGETTCGRMISRKDFERLLRAAGLT